MRSTLLLLALLLAGCAHLDTESPGPEPQPVCVDHWTPWDHLWWMQCLEPLAVDTTEVDDG